MQVDLDARRSGGRARRSGATWTPRQRLADGRSNQMRQRWRRMGRGQPAEAARVIERQRPFGPRSGTGLRCMQAIAAARAGLAAVRRLTVIPCRLMDPRRIVAFGRRCGRGLVARRNALDGHLSGHRRVTHGHARVARRRMRRERRTHPIQDERQAQQHSQQGGPEEHGATLPRSCVAECKPGEPWMRSRVAHRSAPSRRGSSVGRDPVRNSSNAIFASAIPECAAIVALLIALRRYHHCDRRA